MHTPDDFVHAERFYAAVMTASCVCLVLARIVDSISGEDYGKYAPTYFILVWTVAFKPTEV